MLGLWYVFLSVGGVVTLFDFGFNPTIARNVAYCWSGAKELTLEGTGKAEGESPNYSLLKKVIITCKTIYLIISIIALFVLMTFGTVYIFYISKNIINFSVKFSWFIYVAAVFLNLYYGYYATLLRGVGAVSVYNKINVLARLIQIIVSILLLIMGYGLVAVSLAYMLYGFLLRLFSKEAFYKYKEIGTELEYIKNKTDFDEIKALFYIIWYNAKKDGFVAISNYFAGQASTLIASAFLSLTDTGIYSISVQLITAIATISAGLYTAFQPAMQSSYANKNKKRLIGLMSLSMIVYFVLFWIGVIGLITVGIPILKWVKPENIYDVGVIAGLAIYNFLYKRQSYYASFISNTNHVPYVKAYVLSSVASVLLSVILIKSTKMGVWSLIVGQFIPQLIYNVWKWPKEVYRMLGIRWTAFVKSGFEHLKDEYLQKGV